MSARVLDKLPSRVTIYNEILASSVVRKIHIQDLERTGSRFAVKHGLLRMRRQLAVAPLEAPWTVKHGLLRMRRQLAVAPITFPRDGIDVHIDPGPVDHLAGPGLRPFLAEMPGM